MPKKYDDDFKTRAVRLVTDHAEEYDTRTACVVAVATRLGVAPETLRRWITQTEVDAGVCDGVPTEIARENWGLKRRNASLRGPSKSSKRQLVGDQLLSRAFGIVRNPPLW